MKTTSASAGRIPPGPAEPCAANQDLLRWMQLNFERYGDIYKASIYGSDVYVVNAPEYAEHVLLRNWQNYLRRGQAVKRIALSLGNGLISSNGPLWVKQRRMIQPAFTREGVGALREAFMKPNVALREKWRQAARVGGVVDITRDISSTVLEVTLLAIFGDDYEKVAPYFAIIAEESRNLRFAQTCSALARIIVQIASERRAQGREANDILGTMMRSRDRAGGQPMPDPQLAREALTLVIAGHETTASVLNWIWYLLSRHPEVEAKLVGEVRGLLGNAEPAFEGLGSFTYTRQVIEEALRTYPPLWLMTRTATSPDMLGEYLVPAGTEIYISPYLLQRHPHLWQDPDRFDPGRFDSEEEERPRLSMCPFGAGPRNCIGEFFARVEMQIHLLLIAGELQLRYDDAKPAEFVADVNLLSRWHFIMQPLLREPAPSLRDSETLERSAQPHQNLPSQSFDARDRVPQ
jgi:enediyne biosynthesis protein E7